MNLSAPKLVTFWIAVAVAALGVLATLIPTIGLSGYGGWLVLIAFVILAAGNLLQGL